MGFDFPCKFSFANITLEDTSHCKVISLLFNEQLRLIKTHSYYLLLVSNREKGF